MHEVERDNCNDWQEEWNLRMPVFLMERELRDGGVDGSYSPPNLKKHGIQQGMGCGEGWKNGIHQDRKNLLEYEHKF